MNTLIWLTNRNDKGAKKKSVEDFARMVDELQGAPNAEEKTNESEAFLRKKGMVIGSEALDKLDIFALELFEELLPKDVMLEVKRKVASHPETPNGLLEVLAGDLDPDVIALADANVRESRRDSRVPRPRRSRSGSRSSTGTTLRSSRWKIGRDGISEVRKRCTAGSRSDWASPTWRTCTTRTP